ncbi:MAG: LysM peptidoglycan-binding domain-containing protein [Planctomycetota bacterium]
MTSDAKIGLLLGLVFIFIIAFIINGLPRFRSDANSSELTTTFVSQQDETPGIADRERKAQDVFIWTKQAKKELVDAVQRASEDKEDIRYKMPLPTRPSVLKKDDSITKTVVPAALSPTANGKTKTRKPKSVKPALPKTYVVTEGDNLAVIAQKFYGAEEGNRKMNVMRIFRANRELLESPDEIHVGQELAIPPLPTLTPNKDKIGSVLSGKVFEKVESIGKRWLPTDRPKGGKAKQSRPYVVREGDSLWQIATERLGDPSRYKEICKLNANILDDEDTLIVGMRLIMPAQ